MDKYGRDQAIYYDYEIRTYQRPPPNLSRKNKFGNMRAEHIYPANFGTLFAGKNMWMIKPSGLSRGRGLELFTKLDELKKFLHMFTKDGYFVQDYSVLGYSDDQVHSPWVEFQESENRSGDSNSGLSSEVEQCRGKNEENAKRSWNRFHFHQFCNSKIHRKTVAIQRLQV